MTQKKTIPKKVPKRVERVEHPSAKKCTQSLSNKEEEESDGRSRKDRRTNALNVLNALNVRHLKNVPRRRPMKKKKVTKEIKKRGETTKISWPIPHKKLRHRSER